MMKRYLLLIFLSSWSLLVPHSMACETGVAHEDSVLSVQRSLLANADVAYLTTYNASSVEQCMKECCTGKYGACTVSSFTKNVTVNNCKHFYCEPLTKCRFLSSKSTDSFSFSSKPLVTHSVPLSPSSKEVFSTTPTSRSTLSPNFSTAKEMIATYSEERLTLKNDYKSIKPRKGVEDILPDVKMSKSSIKPRKGVTLEDISISEYLDDFKSNVKPRKGVEPYSAVVEPTPITTKSIIYPTTSRNHQHTISKYINSSEENSSDDLLLALQKVFGDDTNHSVGSESLRIASVTSSVISSSPISLKTDVPSISEQHFYSTKTLSTASSDWSTIQSSEVSESGISVSSTPVLMSSVKSSKAFTTSTIVSSSTTYYLTMPNTAAPGPLVVDVGPSYVVHSVEQSKDKENDLEEESEKKYKSSIHLILSLVFGLMVLFAVLGVVAKRVYDGWVRRDYYRMNYLIDGIYNGVN